jgi:hypothetical protein
MRGGPPQLLPILTVSLAAALQDQLANCTSLYVEDQLHQHYKDLVEFVKKAEQTQKRLAVPEGAQIPGQDRTGGGMYYRACFGIAFATAMPVTCVGVTIPMEGGASAHVRKLDLSCRQINPSRTLPPYLAVGSYVYGCTCVARLVDCSLQWPQKQYPEPWSDCVISSYGQLCSCACMSSCKPAACKFQQTCCIDSMAQQAACSKRHEPVVLQPALPCPNLVFCSPGYAPAQASLILKDFARRWMQSIEAMHKEVARHFAEGQCGRDVLQVRTGSYQRGGGNTNCVLFELYWEGRSL